MSDELKMSRLLVLLFAFFITLFTYSKNNVLKRMQINSYNMIYSLTERKHDISGFTIVYFSNKRYLAKTFESVYSMMNTLKHSPLHVIVKVFAKDFDINVDCIQERIKALNEMSTSVEIQFLIFKIRLDEYFISNVSVGTYDKIVLCRLLLPFILEDKYILHMDGDAIATSDFSELINVSFIDKNLYGIRDPECFTNPVFKDYLRKHELDNTNYINGGIFFFENNDATKELFNQTMKYVNTHESKYADQDAINHVFLKNGSLGFLPEKYNCRIVYPKEKCKIHHYYGIPFAHQNRIKMKRFFKSKGITSFCG